MLVKIMLYGNEGTGKTHLSVEIAKELGAILIDVDEGADPIIRKLNAKNKVKKLHGTPYTQFEKALHEALRSNAPMIIIDSLTELMEQIKTYIVDKAVRTGRFYLQGMHEKVIQDPDMFMVTWELHPTIYDKIRRIMRKVISSHKGYIVTYHPPVTESKGKIAMFREIARIVDIVAGVNQKEVVIKKDRFDNRLGTMTTEEFIEYVRGILKEGEES